METTAYNINEIKSRPTVTNPIKAADIKPPQAYPLTTRRAIVADCTPAQRRAYFIGTE